MNILISINEIFTMPFIGVLIGFIVPLFILLFSAKYRGIWASLWLLPVLFAGLSFAALFPQVSAILNSNDIIIGACNGFSMLMEPFMLIVDETIFSLIGLIPENIPFVHDVIVVAPWFPLALYGVLWLLFLAIFKKKRRRKKVKRYEDDF